MPDTPATADADILNGRLHVYVAFDWGEEIDLEIARQQGTGVVLDMMRRPRTPASIAYRPPPLRFPLGPHRPRTAVSQTAARDQEAGVVGGFLGGVLRLPVPAR